jgi:hypothetical protein
MQINHYTERGEERGKKLKSRIAEEVQLDLIIVDHFFKYMSGRMLSIMWRHPKPSDT